MIATTLMIRANGSSLRLECLRHSLDRLESLALRYGPMAGYRRTGISVGSVPQQKTPKR